MHHLPLDENKLKTLVKQCKHFNIFPMFLPRYFGAEQHPITDLLTELAEECVQYLLVMTEQEIDSLLDSLPVGARMFIDRDPTSGQSTSDAAPRTPITTTTATSTCWSST